MSAAPLPADEEQRLAATRRYAVLDTPPDAEFDDLVRLAAQICDAPIALITLVDDERQWFKAKVGLDLAQTRAACLSAPMPCMDPTCSRWPTQRSIRALPTTLWSAPSRKSVSTPARPCSTRKARRWAPCA
jgi:GAF domain-containing protein